MNQRIRVLQELGEEFERAITPAPATSPELDDKRGPRRRISSPLPWAVGVTGRRTAARRIGLALAAIVPVAIVVGALLLLVHAGHGQENVSGGPTTGGVRPTMLVARAPDPHGGLPWAVREVHTPDGKACLEVGRLKGGTIGALGQDGAYANDGRFHPMALNSSPSGGLNCGLTDRNGNVFINISDNDAVANAAGDAAVNESAHGPAARVLLCPASSNTGKTEPTKTPRCPKGDLRDLAYGLLGPDAVSITYLNANGRLVGEPTTGADGAYLIVRPYSTPPCVLTSAIKKPQCGAAGSNGPLLQSGVITAVTYRNGHVCHLPAPAAHGVVKQASCPPLGYRSPPVKHVTDAQVAAPVTARVLPAKHYCNSTGPNVTGCKQVVIDVAFTARAAVTSPNSYYEAIVNMPPRDYTPGGRTGCPGGVMALGPTQMNIHLGQRVHWRDDAGSYPKDCPGNIIHITVAYVPNSYLGLNGVGSRPLPSPGRGSIIVGKTSAVLP